MKEENPQSKQVTDTARRCPQSLLGTSKQPSEPLAIHPPRLLGEALLSADRKRGQRKGATSKIAKKFQKYFRHFSTSFAQGKKTSKIAKNCQKCFRHFSTISRGASFLAPFGGSCFPFSWSSFARVVLFCLLFVEVLIRRTFPQLKQKASIVSRKAPIVSQKSSQTQPYPKKHNYKPGSFQL